MKFFVKSNIAGEYSILNSKLKVVACSDSCFADEIKQLLVANRTIKKTDSIRLFWFNKKR